MLCSCVVNLSTGPSDLSRDIVDSTLLFHCQLFIVVAWVKRVFCVLYRAFLLKNTHYEESVAMRLLSNHGQWKLLIELSKVRSNLSSQYPVPIWSIL